MSDSLWLWDCSMTDFPVLHSLLEFAQTRVHCVDDAIKPSHPLLPPSLLALSLSQHQGLFQWVIFFASGSQSIGASASVSSFQWIFRINFLQGWLIWSPCSKRLQDHNSKVLILWCSAFFMVQLSHLYMTTGCHLRHQEYRNMENGARFYIWYVWLIGAVG